MTWTVYGLIDPRTGHVRYVGCTSLTLARRVALHLSEPGDTPKRAWITDLRVAGLRPIVVTFSTHDAESPALVAEATLIDGFATSGASLVNRAWMRSSRNPKTAGRKVVVKRFEDLSATGQKRSISLRRTGLLKREVARALGISNWRDITCTVYPEVVAHQDGTGTVEAAVSVLVNKIRERGGVPKWFKYGPVPPESAFAPVPHLALVAPAAEPIPAKAAS